MTARDFLRLALPAAAALAIAGACSSGGTGTHGSAGPGGHDSATSTGTAAGGATGSGTGSGTGGENPCADGADAGPDEDRDKDGFTINQGDCDDCNAAVNPGAVEIASPGADGGVGNGVDDDCNGLIDDVEPPCDQGLAVDAPTALDAARAVDLCHSLDDPRKWGLVGAKWTQPDGSPPPNQNFHLGHGLFSSFGPSVHAQLGERMLALSSGAARLPGDPDFQDPSGFDKGYSSGYPAGFPKDSPSCSGVKMGAPHDGIALEVTLVAPTNARGFSFRFNFFTYEWPHWVCSKYNDFFVALLDPPPPGLADGNVSFDGKGNPISVNSSFLNVCGCAVGPPCMANGKSFACPLGDTFLMGTGYGSDTTFEDHGSTYWLESRAPVEPHSQITLRWTVYDSEDGYLDTTTLIDGWQWIAEPVEVGTSAAVMPK